MNLTLTEKEVRKCTNSKLLAEYALTIKLDIKIAVAENPYTPTHTLNDLATESNGDILLAVAKNNNTGKRGLHRLGVKMRDETLAYAVAKNYKTTTDILDAIFEIWNDCPKIVKAIKTHPNVSSYTAELCTFCEMK